MQQAETKTMCDVLLALELTARTARGALTDNDNVIAQLSDKLVSSETLRVQQQEQSQQVIAAATRKCDSLGAEVHALGNKHDELIRSVVARVSAVCASNDPDAGIEMLRALRDELNLMLPQQPAEPEQGEGDIRGRALATLEKTGSHK